MGEGGGVRGWGRGRVRGRGGGTGRGRGRGRGRGGGGEGGTEGSVCRGRWMVLRQRFPYCVRSKRNPDPALCLNVAGRRKFIVNPRLVSLACHRASLCS